MDKRKEESDSSSEKISIFLWSDAGFPFEHTTELALIIKTTSLCDVT
jgi:hypothetical protein